MDLQQANNTQQQKQPKTTMTTTTPSFPPKVISFVVSKDDGELTVVTNPTVFQPLIPDQHGEIYLNGIRDLAKPLAPETEEEHGATATATTQPQHEHEPPEQTMVRDDTCPPLQIITTAQTQTHPMQQQPLNPVSPAHRPREQTSWQPQQPHHQQTLEPWPSVATTAIVPVSPSPPRNVNNNNDTDNRSTTENTAITVTSVSTTTGARLREGPDGGNVDLDYDGTHKPYPREIGRLKRRRKRVTATVGIVGGLVGLVTLGPLGGVAFGAGGAAATRVVAKRREKKKRQALADREIAQQLAGAPEVLCHKGIMA